MIIFIKEDRAYLSWLKRHRGGYVLDFPRNSRNRDGTLHRSSCSAICTGKPSHWTTGGRLKAWSMNLAELSSWAQETSGSEPLSCETCQPVSSSATQGAAEEDFHTLPPLARHIVDYLLEIAAIQLTNGEALRLTIADVASCLQKTPGQLTQAMGRLLETGYITLSKPRRRDGAFSSSATILPTIIALRTLDAFVQSSDDELQAELERLQPLSRIR